MIIGKEVKAVPEERNGSRAELAGGESELGEVMVGEKCAEADD